MKPMTAKQIESRLYSFFPIGQYMYHFANVYLYSWESDFFCLSKSGYAYEIEIKVSLADFRADFKKIGKHRLLSSKMDKVVLYRKNSLPSNPLFQEAISKNDISLWPLYVVPPCSPIKFKDRLSSTPNRFAYAVPAGLLDRKLVPDYAGLIEMDGHRTKWVKNPPLLHRNKQDLTKRLLEKYFYNYMNLKQKYEIMKNELDIVKSKI